MTLHITITNYLSWYAQTLIFYFDFLFFLSIFCYFLDDEEVCDSYALLSLVPPSCMVVPIRDIRNKFFSTSANMNLASKMTFTNQHGDEH